MSTLSQFKKAEHKAKAEKPTMPDPTGELSQLVTDAIEAKATADASTAVLDQAKARFATVAVMHLFKSAYGKTDPEDTFQILAPKGKAMVSMKNAYKVPTETEALRVLLGEHAATYLRTREEITIDASAIPESVQAFFLGELLKVARTCDEMMLGIDGDGPVFSAITVKATVKVDTAFHADRHRLFTPAENLVIHTAMPCVVSTRLDY